MTPSNANINKTPTPSASPSFSAGEFKDKIKDLFQDKDQKTPPKLLGHSSGQDSSMEGIVSITAASMPVESTNGFKKAQQPQQLKAEILSANKETAYPDSGQQGLNHTQITSPKNATVGNHLVAGHDDQHLTPTSPSRISDRSSQKPEQRITDEELEEDEDHEEADMEPEEDAYRISDDKYRRLKQKLREVLEENEQMSRDLNKSHRRVRNLRREKHLLLDRLNTLEQQDSDSGSDTVSSLSSDSDVSDSSITDEIQPRRLFSSQTAGKMNGGKNARAPSSTVATAATTQHPKKATGKTAISVKEPKIPASTPSTITNVGSATQKPKRIHQTNKQRPAVAKVRKVQALERDEAGNIKLPVTVGIITIQSIGHVVYDREAFHNDRYIWPVGYKMSRLYNSMIDPHNQTTYTCSVIDDGEAPKFQIDAEDQPGKPIIAGTATGAWTHVVKAANAIRKRDHSNSASGPDYFGFSNATIAKMIQDLPNADKCESYIMQRFEEPSAATTSSTKTGSQEKRKASALGPPSKSGDQEEEKEQGAGEDDGDDDVDDDEYASLGTPGKKKVRASSPQIRHAGFVLPSVKSEGEQGVMSASNGPHPVMDDDANGDETHFETGPEDREGLHSKSASAPPHFVAMSEQNQPFIAMAASGDSEVIDIEDHDSEVDVGMDEDIPTSQGPSFLEPSTAAAQGEDDGMTTDEDVTIHHS
ncbi:hypothetical protein BC939DRAFT_481344 [Gamsiella multidivaricata]|uniref:uncharacterized protein n=1 Tax=Gamsiella multidivaricata TaxID=101098 RepID=UPI002220366B|nr:uncharacterized protein BC939DRAFT_481344 [Gamsiella multidivaricata]KAG0360960.1 hypothetical protein BGZ54_009310 [Gamsiella multidivaricata]KAI7817209.1 hypothetical protein BC939DRAFT_481344 [Gamsiella multidivaricata]